MFLFDKSRPRYLWTTIALLGTAAILYNAKVYFQSGPTPVFLLEKGELRHHVLWRTAFLFHIVGAIVCLAAGPLLMFGRLIRQKQFHRVVGYIYLNAVLWIAAPTGLIISPVAKGGWISAAGFTLTGVLWWVASWFSYRAIRRGDVPAHICWAVRSYAIALSAVAFRVIQIALSFVLNNQANYVASVWLSLIASIWISEICIARHYCRNQSTSRWVSTLSPSSLSPTRT